MKTLKVKNDFTLNGNWYFKGDEIKSECLTIDEIVRLNEKGFIEPLSQKELFALNKEIRNNNCKVKEEK